MRYEVLDLVTLDAEREYDLVTAFDVTHDHGGAGPGNHVGTDLVNDTYVLWK